jgi:hypothetical protein
MDDTRLPPGPREAEERFAAMLAEEGLPCFDSAVHDAPSGELQLRWHHGLTLCLDLNRDDMEPLDDWERAAILGVLPNPGTDEPVHISIPGSEADPRAIAPIPGVEVHYVPPLHPDDVTVLDGMPVTSPSRTLIDCAEYMTTDELRDAFARADTRPARPRGAPRGPPARGVAAVAGHARRGDRGVRRLIAAGGRLAP